MNKRDARRYKRRLQLKFWNPEDEIVKNGFTLNVSLHGMFICTGSPCKPGVRIVIEISDGNTPVHLQGIVQHAIRVDPALQGVRQSGMGVRLLRTEEIIGALLTAKHDREKDVTEDTAGDEVAEDGLLELADDQRRRFGVTFATPQEFRISFQRDLRFGGLFVATPDLPARDEQVIVEFLFGWNGGTSVVAPAVVVKLFPAVEGLALGDSQSGIGVAFTDPAEALRQFAEVLEILPS